MSINNSSLHGFISRTVLQVYSILHIQQIRLLNFHSENSEWEISLLGAEMFVNRQFDEGSSVDHAQFLAYVIHRRKSSFQMFTHIYDFALLYLLNKKIFLCS